MWATLTLMSALSMAPSQAGDLQITNARTTYGRLGPTRTEKKFLPGEIYFISFDIEGLQFDKKGVANYSMQMKLFDANGKQKYATTDVPHELFAIQGAGGRLPQDAFAAIGADDPAGEYSMEVSVTDISTKKTVKLTRKYEVVAKDFGVVRLACSYDPEGMLLAPGQACVGQVLFLRFGAVGFQRDAKTKLPSIRLEMRMLGEDGKPTLEDPVTENLPQKGETPDEYALAVVPLRFPLALTKAGNYTVELKATDLLSKKTSTVTYPLKVLDAPK